MCGGCTSCQLAGVQPQSVFPHALAITGPPSSLPPLPVLSCPLPLTHSLISPHSPYSLSLLTSSLHCCCIQNYSIYMYHQKNNYCYFFCRCQPVSSAAMATGSGFGRGGRGAALLKLLEQPIRRPGQQAPPTNGSNGTTSPPSQVQYVWSACIYMCTYM